MRLFPTQRGFDPLIRDERLPGIERRTEIGYVGEKAFDEID